MGIGCENELNIDIPEHESYLVVEGWIDQEQGAKVLLSLSAPFFADIDSNNLREYAVTSAKVTLKSDNTEEILTLKPNSVYFPPYYYFGSEIKGETGKEYTIEINLKGESYTANTTIPQLNKPDSIWFEVVESDTLGLIWIKISDNADEKNYYRTLTKIKGVDNKFIPTYTSVFSDNLFNGQTIDFSLSKGNTNILDIENNRFFTVGDTIILRFCSIDEEHYNFWKTLGTQVITSVNPFAVSNASVQSNIQTGLGIWGGYAVWYDTIIAK